MKKIFLVTSFAVSVIALVSFTCRSNQPAINTTPGSATAPKIVTGADRTDAYVPYLKGKRVGMLVNQTSIIGKKLSVDSLLALGINVVTVFGPEHGFRGNASNGAAVDDEVDAKTGIKIVSLYGRKRKPTKEEMDAVDIMIFDIQDVGCRFYTNINTLSDVMEACAESNKELVIFDRPNPNAYVDGPVMEMEWKSGIGKFPIPITHGMTIGEFAQMINGQRWLPNGVKCKLKIIEVLNYDHSMNYTLPVAPSPNLNTQQSILLYPTLCLFEGTVISQGRGTYMPFTVLGNPELKDKYTFSFTPKAIQGMSENPLHKDKTCYGLDLRNYDAQRLHDSGKINLSWLKEFYENYPYKEKFFDFRQSTAMGEFNYRSGNAAMKQQIIDGVSEEEIRKSWEPGLSQYKEMRKKYLLYK